MTDYPRTEFRPNLERPRTEKGRELLGRIGDRWPAERGKPEWGLAIRAIEDEAREPLDAAIADLRRRHVPDPRDPSYCAEGGDDYPCAHALLADRLEEATR